MNDLQKLSDEELLAEVRAGYADSIRKSNLAEYNADDWIPGSERAEKALEQIAQRLKVRGELCEADDETNKRTMKFLEERLGPEAVECFRIGDKRHSLALDAYREIRRMAVTCQTSRCANGGMTPDRYGG